MAGVAEPVVREAKKLRIRSRSRADSPGGKLRRCVAFPELVQAHFIREAALRGGAIYSGPDEERYREFESAFERRHGRIINAYWCTSTPSAVALTQRDSAKRSEHTIAFHRVSDWATKDEPEIADALHECDELAVRAAQVLQGKTLQICMQLVMASAAHLLSLVDGPSEHEGKGKKELALKLERRKLEKTRSYYHQAANGQAQLYYFGGMVLGVLVLASLSLSIGFAAALPGIDNRDVFGSLTAGTLGALVSVMSRIGSGQFRLDYDVGRRYPIFLGSLRPVIGAIFGLALYFAVTSSLLDVFKLPKDDNHRFYFLLVIAFLAGFSERWARDTLLSFGAPAASPGSVPHRANGTQPASG
jgi:hypothetical protein